MLLPLILCSGKTSAESCPPETMPLDVFSERSLEKMARCSRQGAGGRTLVVSLGRSENSHGVFSTLNTSAWPNGAAVCLLSGVLETGPIHARFFLSAKACSGILRRSARRGRALPPALRRALERVAGVLPGSESPGDRTR